MRLWRLSRPKWIAPPGQVGRPFKPTFISEETPSSPNDSIETARLDNTYVSAIALPLEIIELVIDNLDNDRATLERCCIVCKSWLPRSRVGLFSTPVTITREKAERLYTLLLSPYRTISRSSLSLSILIPEERRWPHLFLKNLIGWKLVLKKIHITISAPCILKLGSLLETFMTSVSVQALHLSLQSSYGDLYSDEDQDAADWLPASDAVFRLINCCRTLSNLHLEGWSIRHLTPGINASSRQNQPLQIQDLTLDTLPVDEYLPILFNSRIDFAVISVFHIGITTYSETNQYAIERFLAISEFRALRTLSVSFLSVTEDNEYYKNAVLELTQMPNLHSLRLLLSIPGIQPWSRMTHPYICFIDSVRCKRALDTIIAVLKSAHSSSLVSIELHIAPKPYKLLWDDTTENTADLLRFDHLLNDGRFPNLAQIVLKDQLTPLFPISEAKGLLKIQRIDPCK